MKKNKYQWVIYSETLDQYFDDIKEVTTEKGVLTAAPVFVEEINKARLMSNASKHIYMALLLIGSGNIYKLKFKRILQLSTNISTKIN